MAGSPYATDGTGIYTVAADGSDPVTLKSDNARLPRWSPDGSKIAFIEYVDGPHGPAVQLKVMNADGADEHVVATADWREDIWLSKQPGPGRESDRVGTVLRGSRRRHLHGECRRRGR